LVAPDKLRFDFTYPKALSESQINEVENSINDIALQNIKLRTESMRLEEALAKNAVATFTENYPPAVRTVNIPNYSLELCAGTHLSSTKPVFPFKILHQSSVAAGTRRIEAVAGTQAVKHLLSKETQLKCVTDCLGGKNVNPVDTVKTLRQTIKTQERAINELVTLLAECDSKQITIKLVNDPSFNYPLQLHAIPSQYPLSFLQKRAHFLKSSRESDKSKYVHILTTQQPTKGKDGASETYPVIVVVGSEVKELNAKEVLMQLISKYEGSGGGGATLSQGKLKSIPDIII